jgi:hypothetical protein
MSAASFAGRLADLNVMRTDPATGLVTFAMVAPPDGGQLCVGIQKLFQRYMLILLTKKGSMLYLPNAGCTFMLDGDAGLWRTTFDVAQSFISAGLDVYRQMLAVEQDTDPPDEMFADARLTNITLTADRVGITVQVTSQAGTSVEYIVPIATVPQ